MRTCFLFFFWFIFISTNSIAQKKEFTLRSNGEYFLDRNYEYVQIDNGQEEGIQLGVIYDQNGQTRTAVLKGGTNGVLSLFQEKVKNGNTPQQKIKIEISRVVLTESYNSATKLYEGDIELKMKFYLLGKADPIALTDYLGSLSYRRSANRSNQVQFVVNSIFHKALEYFDSWQKIQSEGNPVLASKVKLKILDEIRENKTDTVFYNPENPLVWSDFKDSPPSLSDFNASIFTSFSIDESSIMVDGYLYHTVDIKTYMLPKQSWVKTPSDYGIAHERLHFDLVKIQVNKFKQKLLELALDPQFYTAEIYEAYLDALRELAKKQEQYDQETKNGLNPEQQKKWSNLIEHELKTSNENFKEKISK